MDAVILYVNGADPEWQKDYYQTMMCPLSPERFRDWGTLPYLFRGIAQNLPWIDKVFLVVSRESQVPAWIDRSQVRVVLHEEIIPKKYLPTFNSCVIETHIPYIPELGEEFLYFNDDMFPLNPCTPELFFKEGRPQDRLRVRSIKEPPIGMYRYQCLNSANMARRALGQWETGEYFFPYHWPHPLKKSLCLEVLQKQKDRYLAQISRTRTDRNVNQYLFLDYMYLKGELDDVSLPYGYVTPARKSPEEMADLIKNTEKGVICVNDSGAEGKDYDRYEEAVLGAFRAKFPEICKYEKGWYDKTGTVSEKEGSQAKVIVCMTSYPARIKFVAGVWRSVFMQMADEPVKCVLVLTREEFQGVELPASIREMADRGQIEILWSDYNIRSHSKVMPVVEKYPNATLLAIDDDMTKPQGWLQNLLDDHRRWPEDIISCSYTFFLNSQMQWARMLDLPQKTARGKNDIPSLVFNFARICSGHGTLFPAHTFTDRRFFDTEKMMELTPTCDETWMWMWAMIEGKRFRQSSWIFDESEYNIERAYRMPTALWRANREIYDRMYEGLFKAFPEFLEEIRRRQREYVLATEETLEEARKNNPYSAVIMTRGDDVEELLKMYQDRPNRVSRTEKGIIYPPGWK